VRSACTSFFEHAKNHSWCSINRIGRWTLPSNDKYFSIYLNNERAQIGLWQRVWRRSMQSISWCNLAVHNSSWNHIVSINSICPRAVILCWCGGTINFLVLRIACLTFFRRHPRCMVYPSLEELKKVPKRREEQDSFDGSILADTSCASLLALFFGLKSIEVPKRKSATLSLFLWVCNHFRHSGRPQGAGSRSKTNQHHTINGTHKFRGLGIVLMNRENKFGDWVSWLSKPCIQMPSQLGHQSTHSARLS
jgi:hypothetical protein